MWLTGNPQADELIGENDNALLIGMLLDQQVTMEKAFAGPAVIAERMGGKLEVAAIAAADAEDFAALCSTPPAIHRFPGSMAKRVQQLCQVLVADYAGEASSIWTEAADAEVVLRRLQGLPGFGEQKAKIFLSLLAKQRGIQPAGWRRLVGDYGKAGYRSVADVVDAESLQRVRTHKKEQKAAAKAAKGVPG